MLENLYLIFNILSPAIMMNKTFKIPNFIAYNGKQVQKVCLTSAGQ